MSEERKLAMHESAKPRPALPLADPQLLAAMDHPYRVHIMGVLNQRVASQGEIAKELKVESNTLSYHFHKLEALGVIEFVREERTSGGQLIGRFYRATVRGWIESDEWKTIDPKDQPAVTAMILANCNADLQAAITAGTIHGEDNVIARVPAAVDREGWREVSDLLNEATREIVHIAERSAARMRPGDELIPIKVHILQMESPGPGELALDH
jgi:DNA-binding MarR family transcriptional regulator